MVIKGIWAVQAGHDDWLQFEAEDDKEEKVGDCWVLCLVGGGVFWTGTETVDAVESGEDDRWGFSDRGSKLSTEAFDLWIVWVQNKTLGPWTSQKCSTDSNAFIEWWVCEVDVEVEVNVEVNVNRKDEGEQDGWTQDTSRWQAIKKGIWSRWALCTHWAQLTFWSEFPFQMSRRLWPCCTVYQVTWWDYD